MTTKSLTDITNTVSHSRTLNKTAKDPQNNLESTKLPGDHQTSFMAQNAMSFSEDQSIENSVNGGNVSKTALGLGGESMSGNDVSKQRLTELSKQLNDELDEFDQMGGPASVFNNTNVDEMLAAGDITANGFSKSLSKWFICFWSRI